MRCPECGADLQADALFCPECGANPNPEPVKRAGCHRLLPLVWVALALLLALSLLVLAAYLGASQGKKQWQANAEATANA